MCGRLVNLDTVARVLAEYYHLKTETQLAALDEALSKVPAVSVGGGHGKDHVADPGKMVGDLISRQAAIDAAVEAADEWDGGYSRSREEIITMKLRMLPSAEPNLQPTCNQLATDCISRQAAIEALAEWHDAAITNRLNNLPPAQQWIPCSECKKRCEKWEHLKT